MHNAQLEMAQCNAQLEMTQYNAQQIIEQIQNPTMQQIHRLRKPP